MAGLTDFTILQSGAGNALSATLQDNDLPKISDIEPQAISPRFLTICRDHSA
jgi:hypothetical protein